MSEILPYVAAAVGIAGLTVTIGGLVIAALVRRDDKAEIARRERDAAAEVARRERDAATETARREREAAAEQAQRERDARDGRRFDELFAEVRQLRDGTTERAVKVAEVHGMIATALARLEPIAADVARDRHTFRDALAAQDARVVAIDRRVLALEQRS